MDDTYPVGTWTPVEKTGDQSGQLYAASVGRYIKIGVPVLVKCFAWLTLKAE